MGTAVSTRHEVAQSTAMQAAIKKEKKRAKKWFCFGALFIILCLTCWVIGIILLSYYASSLRDSYTGETNRDTAKGVTYFGIALILLGVLLLLIGVVFCVALYIAYKRLSKKDDGQTHFKAKTYAPGSAPYPQQDWGDASPPIQPSAPPSDDHRHETPVKPDMVHAEMR